MMRFDGNARGETAFADEDAAFEEEEEDELLVFVR